MAQDSSKPVGQVLEDAMSRFEGARSRCHGTILLRLLGEGGGEFHLHSDSNGCGLSRQAGQDQPLVEIIGDAAKVRAVLDGSREGLAQFYRGGIRVRGDLRYLSGLAHELGFIRQPF